MSIAFTDIQAMLASRPVMATPHEELCHGVIPFLEKNNVFLSPEWLEVIRVLSVMGGVQWPQLTHPRVALYASGYGQDNRAVQDKLQKLAKQQDSFTQLCALLDADLRVYELDLETPLPPEGLSEEAACHALSYGLMAVEEHVDGLLVGSLSIGAEQVLKEWHDVLQNNTKIDVFLALQQARGGTDIFAMLGALCAARMAKIPVFIAGEHAQIWRLVAARLLPDDALSHVVCLPDMVQADSIVQTLQAVQHLRFLLALVPQIQNKTDIQMPDAA